MKSKIVYFCIGLLVGCSTISDIIPVGVETFTVSSRMSGNMPTWAEVKGAALKRANEFCDAKGKQMEVSSWDTHGARGWTPLEAELTFKCIPK